MKPVSFKSVFMDELTALIEIKKSCGFKYENSSLALMRIDQFFIEHGLEKKELSKELCEQWCRRRSHESEKTHSHRISDSPEFF